MIDMQRQMKFDFAMTFQEKMESEGWHNKYDSQPTIPGTYKVYRRNGSIGEAHYCGNHTWQDASGWEFCWWKEV